MRKIRGGGAGAIVPLLAYKAMRLPSWLRLLATSRNNPNVVSLLRQTFGIMEIVAEQQCNQDDLRNYVLSRCKHEPIAIRLREHSKSPDEIASLLQRKSRGKFLYAVRALNDLDSGLMSVPRIGELPFGMDGFYLDAFGRRFLSSESYETVREMLGLLAIAKQPLTPSELSSMLDINEDEVDERALLIADFVRYISGAYSLDHKSLTEWLTLKDENRSWRAANYHVDSRSAEVKLRNWALRQFEKRQVYKHPYLLHHIASHLDKNEIVRIFTELLLDYHWLSAKIAVFGMEGCKVINKEVEMVQFISAVEALGVEGDEDIDMHVKMVQEGEISVRVSPDTLCGPLYFRKVSGNGKDFCLPPPEFGIVAFSHILSGQEKVILANALPDASFEGFVMVDFDISNASINYKILCSSIGRQNSVRVLTDIVRSDHGSHRANFLQIEMNPMEVQILGSQA